MRTSLSAFLLLLLPSTASAQDDEIDILPQGTAPAGAPADTWVWDSAGLLTVDAIDYDADNRREDALDTRAASWRVRGRSPEGQELYFDAGFGDDAHDPLLREAWWSAPQGATGRLRLGRLRLALGSEAATPAELLPYVGPSFPSTLDGLYETAVAYDAWIGEGFWYEVSAGVGQGFNLEGEAVRDPSLALRGAWLPDADRAGRFVGPHAGLGWRRFFDYDQPVQVATPIGQRIFDLSDLEGDGGDVFHVELGWRGAGFRAGFESVTGTVDGIPDGAGGQADIDELGAFQLFLAVNLRGEPPVWERGAWAPAPGGELPIEWTVRIANADIDRDLFLFGLTSFGVSSQETDLLATGISAWISPSTRIAIELVSTQADQALATFGGHRRDRSLVVRWDQRIGGP